MMVVAQSTGAADRRQPRPRHPLMRYSPQLVPDNRVTTTNIGGCTWLWCPLTSDCCASETQEDHEAALRLMGNVLEADTRPSDVWTTGRPPA